MVDELAQWALRHHVSLEAMAELRTLFCPPVSVSDGSSEARSQSLIRIEAPKRGVRLWRNNSGAMQDETGRLVRFGLGHESDKLNKVFKSSDLIGITPVQFGGYTFGVFTAIECKPLGWKGVRSDHEKAQHNFLTTVRACGGIATFATSVGDVWPS